MITFHCTQQAPFHTVLTGSWPSYGVTALFAPTGSGKTSLLRFFAGLTTPSEGDRLRVDKTVWVAAGQSMPLDQRDVACVFQHHPLLSHLSVKQNLAFSQRFHRHVLTQDEQSLIMDMLAIEPLLDKQPDSLSGGERQRVVIALALLKKPRWLLLDEPMTGIDYKHKKILLRFIKAFCQRQGIAVLFISHDMDEIITIGDYLALMQEGQLIADGALVDIVNTYQPFAHGTQGGYQLFDMTVRSVSEGVCQLAQGQFHLTVISQHLSVNEQVRIKVLARDVSLSLHDEESSMLNRLPATIRLIQPYADDAHTLVTLNIAGHVVLAEISTFSCQRLNLCVGMKVFALIKATALRI